jgi:segregation and condensation protein B
MMEETNTEIAEALEAVGEKTGGEVAVEAAEQQTALEQPPVEELAPEQLEEYGVEEKAADSETERGRLRAMIEAAVYVSEEPLTIQQLCQGLNQPREVVEGLLAELMQEYSAPHHGVTIREVAGGFKMSTKPEFHEDIRTFVKKLKPPLKLSLAALETLAVVAYKQPVTAPEILEIRGVQGGGVLKTLLERKLITAAGRKQVVGKPVLYKTTKEFLMQFGLKDLAELPTLKEFEEWSRLALGEDAGETPPPEPAPAAEPAE